MKLLAPRARRVLAGLAALTTVAVGGVITAPPAQAASCYHVSCEGLNPQTTGCSNDAYTIGWFGAEEVRWSRACQAVWLRNSSYPISGFQSIRLFTKDTYYSGTWIQEHVYQAYPVNYTTAYWTFMAYMDSSQMVKIGYPPQDSGYFNTLPF